jgi:hypothetical protein
MVEMVKALAEITRLSQDYSVSTAMNAFKRFFKGELSDKTPSEIFFDVIESCKELELDETGELEHVFIDLCYYDYPALVQNSLQVLMVHHSTRQILLENMRQVQLLTTSAEESLHDRLKAKLKLLEEHAEKSELWVEFENPKDFEVCEEVQQILAQLTDEIRTDTETLEYGGDEAANAEIQNILRNLGAFEVAATVLELAGELDDDDDDDDDEESDSDESEDGGGDIEEATSEQENGEDDGPGNDGGSLASGMEETKSKKVREILLLCNTFLTWFVRDNHENQLLAFRNLDLLQETIDAGIDSTRVIAQIFRKNEQLMKEFPDSLVTDFAEKIATNGRKPDYLDLIESIVAFPDFNQLSHQLVIVKEFASSVRQDKLLYLCQDPTSTEYAERQAMMNIKAGIVHPNLEEDLDEDEHHKEMLAEAFQSPPLLRCVTSLSTPPALSNPPPSPPPLSPPSQVPHQDAQHPRWVRRGPCQHHHGRGQDPVALLLRPRPLRHCGPEGPHRRQDRVHESLLRGVHRGRDQDHGHEQLQEPLGRLQDPPGHAQDHVWGAPVRRHAARRDAQGHALRAPVGERHGCFPGALLRGH